MSQVSISIDGPVSVAKNARVSLNPGGIFDVRVGRSLSVEGAISAPGGRIDLATANTQFIDPNTGILRPNAFDPRPIARGAFDLIVGGSLSVRGRWINNLGKSGEDVQAASYLSGGSIGLTGASGVIRGLGDTREDLSGSVLVNAGAVLDVAGGGSVGADGKFNLTARGGSLGLSGASAYGTGYVEPNAPGASITQRVVLDPRATIFSAGFNGGGTFSLATSKFSFSDDDARDYGSTLPLDFISRNGFSKYIVNSTNTRLIQNKVYGSSKLSPLQTNFGVADTKTITIGSGQTLLLRNRVLPSLLDQDAVLSLRGLASGGDLLSVLSPMSVPDRDGVSYAYYRQPVDLTFAGLLELKVAAGGQILGEAGAKLTVPKLINEGLIRLPGGQIVQNDLKRPIGLACNRTSDIYANLTVTTSGLNKGNYQAGALVLNSPVPGLTNQGAVDNAFFLGELPEGVGIQLRPGSVTDLSGVFLRDPLAQAVVGGAARPLQTGRILDGGRITLTPPKQVALSPVFDRLMLSRA